MLSLILLQASTSFHSITSVSGTPLAVPEPEPVPVPVEATMEENNVNTDFEVVMGTDADLTPTNVVESMVSYVADFLRASI